MNSRDPILTLFKLLQARGVVFDLVGGRARWSAPLGVIAVDDEHLLLTHKPTIEAILSPDVTLPDVLTIPADTPNTIEAIRECVDQQRNFDLLDQPVRLVSLHGQAGLGCTGAGGTPSRPRLRPAGPRERGSKFG
jgi:hypothetical protein